MSATDTTVWVGKHPSKTALFTADYPIITKPIIYLMSVKIMSHHPEGGLEPIFTKRLRRLAIEGWVATYLKDHHHVHGIQYWQTMEEEDGMPIDFVLFLFPPDGLASVEMCIKAARWSDKVSIKKKVRNDETGEMSQHDVRCSSSGDLIPFGSEGPEYWKMLGVILRRKVTGEGINDGASGDSDYHRNSSSELLIEAAVRSDPSSSSSATSSSTAPSPTESNFSTSSSSSTIPLASLTVTPTFEGKYKDADEIRVLLRAKGMLHGWRERGSYKIELDLVPGIRQDTDLATFVDRTFGLIEPKYMAYQWLRMVKRALCGLQVKRI
jgi:hypothetical protein